jgi:hypothetical protein
VVTVAGVEAERLKAMDPGAFSKGLRERYRDRFGTMTLEGEVHAYPLLATWAHRFVGRRFALVGDAAVGHPVTAHGFNLGLASVERLSHVVADSMACHRAGCATLFLGTGLVVRVFTDDRLPMRPVRRAIIQAGRMLPPLRHALADTLLDDGPVDPSPLQRLRRTAAVLRPRGAALRGGVCARLQWAVIRKPRSRHARHHSRLSAMRPREHLSRRCALRLCRLRPRMGGR